MNKEEKGLVPMSQSEIDEIRQFTGESKIDNKPRVPYLIFDAKTGIFKKSTGEKDEKGNSILKEIGTEMECTIIRCRKQIGSSKDAPQKVYSQEFESYNDMVTIIDRDSNTKLDTGSYTDLKDRYGKKTIRLNEVVYLFHENELFKLSVKGTSLAPLWAYLSSFGKEDTVLRYKTKISSFDDSNEYGDFKVLEFTKGDVVENWKEFWSQLKDLDSAFTSNIEKKVGMLPGVKEEYAGEVDEEEANFEEVPEDEEIKIENIPF